MRATRDVRKLLVYATAAKCQATLTFIVPSLPPSLPPLQTLTDMTIVQGTIWMLNHTSYTALTSFSGMLTGWLAFDRSPRDD